MPAAGRTDSQEERPGLRPYLAVRHSGNPADLIAEARAAGLDNLPRSDAQHLSGPENTIQAEHVRRHLALTERTRACHHDLEASFGDVEGQLSASEDLAAIVDGALAKVDGELGDERLLVPERRRQQRALRDLRHLV